MTANEGRPRVRRVKIVARLAAGAALILLVVSLRAWLATRHRHAVDSRVITDVERLVRQELERLGPDSEIYRRYGQFRTLEGSGFERPSYAWRLVERVECGRRAVFEKGTADVEIVVASTGSLDVEIKLIPPESSLRERPGTQVVKRGDILWIESPGGVSRSSIYVGATHPEFTAD